MPDGCYEIYAIWGSICSTPGISSREWTGGALTFRPWGRGRFALLVRRFQDMAVGDGYSLVRDFHLAEDAAQEAFFEAYPPEPTARAGEVATAASRRRTRDDPG